MKYFIPRFFESLKVLEHYKYPAPFHLYLKKWFKGKKKFGSKDRKAIGSLCYECLRIRRIFSNLSWEDCLYYSSWLKGNFSSEEELKFRLGKECLPNLDITERREYLINSSGKGQECFYPAKLLCPEFSELNSASLIDFQPKLWLRVEDSRRANLEELGFNSTDLLSGAMSGLQTNLEPNPEIQVQDLSSQFLLSKIDISEQMKVWDCCAGSGGKSIPLIQDNTDFLLSDNRESILANAATRLKFYGKTARLKLLDLSTEANMGREQFDLIIADVPCSGSGTWFRNPEHFSHFDYSQLPHYIERQQAIVTNSLAHLKSGGHYAYITCSVFSSENDEQRDWICKEFGLELKQEYHFKGSDHFADSMYMAIFTKP